MDKINAQIAEAKKLLASLPKDKEKGPVTQAVVCLSEAVSAIAEHLAATETKTP